MLGTLGVCPIEIMPLELELTNFNSANTMQGFIQDFMLGEVRGDVLVVVEGHVYTFFKIMFWDTKKNMTNFTPLSQLFYFGASCKKKLKEQSTVHILNKAEQKWRKSLSTFKESSPFSYPLKRKKTT